MADWLAWQIVDSAFPTGAFAHSWGLEAAWQHGEIPDAAALDAFAAAAAQQAAFGAVPLLNEAWREPRRLEELDAVADAFLLNVVANRASRVQGRTLVATACRIWGGEELAALGRRAEGLAAHAAPIAGAVFRAVGVPLPTVQQVTLHAAVRGVLSAAVRLGIVGGFEAQRLQARSAPVLDRLARECAALGLDDLAQTAPIPDLLQAGHDRLYSRLFQS